MYIKESIVYGSSLLIFSGRLDFRSTPAVRKMLRKQEQAYWQRLLIDVERVTSVDGSGLGLLTWAVKRMQEAKREVVVVNPRGQVRRLFQEQNFSVLTPVMDSDLTYTIFTNIP